jgi:hypothetical protein
MWAFALADQEDDRDAATRGEADPDMDDDEPETAELEFSNERKLRMALASGYVLRTKAEGWKQFCERWNNPPFLLWEDLPAFDQFQSALKLADLMAFTADGLLRWLNKVRPAAHPPITEVPVTAERTAEDVDQAFQIRIEWWNGGKKP